MRILEQWGRWAATHWVRTLVIALCITIAMGFGVSVLRLELTFYSLLPAESQEARDLKQIVENFPAASSIVIVVEADTEAKAISAIDALSEKLAGPELGPHVVRIQGRMDLAFFRDHGLMLSTHSEIERMEQLFGDLSLVSLLRNLNTDFEREYSGNAEQLAEDQERGEEQIRGLNQLLDLLARAAEGEDVTDTDIEVTLDQFLFGSPYFLSRDRTMGLLFVQPTFTINDIEAFTSVIPNMDRIIKTRAAELGVYAGLTGFLVVGKDETLTAEQGLVVSMLIALVLILILLIVSLQMYAVPLIAGFPLLMGITWTAGMAGFVLGRLNIMTAMYMIALVGLGIDYGIHLLTGYVHARDEGSPTADAVGLSMRRSGAAVLTGAITTAIAFFALIVAESQAVKELGIVAGLGIACELLAMFIILPALLGMRAAWLVRRGREDSIVLRRVRPKYRFLDRLGAALARRPGVFALVALIIGAACATQAGRVQVEGNIMNMEAKGLESIELQDVMVKEFGLAPDVLSIISEDLSEIRRLGSEIEDLDTVDRVESLSAFLPSDSDQRERSVAIDVFRSTVASTPPSATVDVPSLAGEGYRLFDNLIEMSDLAYLADLPGMSRALGEITGYDDSGKKTQASSLDRLISVLEGNRPAAQLAERLQETQRRITASLQKKLLRLANPKEISLNEIPASIRDSYQSADGRLYLMNIVPKQNPWVREYREALVSQLGTVTHRATGVVLSGDQMTQIAERDGVVAAIAALIAILVVLLLDFRNVKTAMVTLTPLLLSFGTLFGIMGLAGIKFDFVNIITVPLLIGIGIDDSVHVTHRYLIEGAHAMQTVIARTGKAMFLTTATTVIGFASFIPSIMRAMRSTGIVLSVAMALAFLFSMVFHPSILVLMLERWGMNILPWNQRNRT